MRLILAGLIADGHVLLDDVPGVAKTLTARSIAAAAGLRFSRVQFTPDVLPADITGSLVLDPAARRPEFRPGPVFTDLLLADEVNRAPAKTQAALLEALQERQVTADGVGVPTALVRPTEGVSPAISALRRRINALHATRSGVGSPCRGGAAAPSIDEKGGGGATRHSELGTVFHD